MELLLNIYLPQIFHGLVYGMLLFLVASGLTIIFGLMGVMNIAHAVFYMSGGYIAYTITYYIGNFWLSLLIAPVVVGVLGIMVERFLLRKIHVNGHMAEVLLTFGLFYILTEVIMVFWGKNPLAVAVPELLKGSIPLLGMKYPIYRLFVLGISFFIFLTMIFIILKTRIGIIIRAAVSDRDMVEVLGNNVHLVFVIVMGVGSAFAGLAGAVSAPLFMLQADMGVNILVDSFVVVIVGGTGSLLGAFIAAIMVGELQSLGILLIPKVALIFQFILMAFVLTVSPSGLFGEK